MREADVQRQIVDYLRAKGWVVFETSQKGHSWATPGLPDVIAVKEHSKKCLSVDLVRFPDNTCLYDRTLWIEVKGPRGKMSDAQLAAEDKIRGQGGEYLLANSLDVVMNYLK